MEKGERGGCSAPGLAGGVGEGSNVNRGVTSWWERLRNRTTCESLVMLMAMWGFWMVIVIVIVMDSSNGR